MSVPAVIQKATELFAKVPPSVWPHVLEFAQALVDGDEEKAERAATSAMTERIFKAKVKR